MNELQNALALNCYWRSFSKAHDSPRIESKDRRIKNLKESLRIARLLWLSLVSSSPHIVFLVEEYRVAFNIHAEAGHYSHDKTS